MLLKMILTRAGLTSRLGKVPGAYETLNPDLILTL